MKKLLVISLAVLLVISTAVAGCVPAEEEEEEEEEPGERQVITLDFATFMPSTYFQADGFRNWMSAITDLVEANTPNDETGYTVEWNASWGMPPNVWDQWCGVRNGTYDVIAILPSWTGMMPLWEGPEYPADLCRKNALTMSMAVQALYDEFTPLQDEMDKAGVVPMYFWSSGPGYFFMAEGTEGCTNVTRLEDFQSLSWPVRVPNRGSICTVGALGAEPLGCSMFVVPEKFEDGTLCGILAPPDPVELFNLTPYVTNATFAPFSLQFVFMKVMNQDTWDGLPAKVQDAFNTVNAKWTEYSGNLRTWGEYEGLQCCYDNIPGFSVYDLRVEDPDQYARWVDATADCVTDWMGTNATRQALWDLFVEKDEYYATHEPWASWNHSWPAMPPPPTF